MLHGFLRDKNGVITTFDAPGAGTGAGQGTQSFAISPRGEVTGFYFDATSASSRLPAGYEGRHHHIRSFRAGAPAPSEGTYGGGFTPNGSILGVLIDADICESRFPAG